MGQTIRPLKHADRRSGISNPARQTICEHRADQREASHHWRDHKLNLVHVTFPVVYSMYGIYLCVFGSQLIDTYQFASALGLAWTGGKTPHRWIDHRQAGRVSVH